MSARRILSERGDRDFNPIGHFTWVITPDRKDQQTAAEFFIIPCPIFKNVEIAVQVISTKAVE
jgi:hypothetical protein